MFWPFKRSRNQSRSGSGQQAGPDSPVVPVLIPDVPDHVLDRVPEHAEVSEWNEPEAPPRKAEYAEHVALAIRGLQALGKTGLVPGEEIYRVYPEWAWIANVVPLKRRQMEHALTARLLKRKKRTPGGRQLTHYLIPSHGVPDVLEHKDRAPERVPEQGAKIVAFASKTSRRKERGKITAKHRRKGGRIIKPQRAAA